METLVKASNTKTKAILITIGTVASIFSILCLFFHLTPLGMWHIVADYAAHHYFMFGFISTLVAIGSWRLYALVEDSIAHKQSNL